MAIYDDITFGGFPLNVQTLTPTKKQKTRKSVIGKSVIETKIIGLNAQQWELNLSGTIYGTTTTNLGANRATLEGMDKASAYAFTDNIHNGDFFIKSGSLKFSDSAEDVGSLYRYSMVLIQD